MHKIAVYCLLGMGVAAVLGCGRAGTIGFTPATPGGLAAPPPTTEPVPEMYRAIYDDLSTRLKAYPSYQRAAEDGLQSDTIIAAELIVANGNRGEALLAPGTLAGVELYLDRLQELGVQGVSISLTTPLLDPGFPRHDEYLSFYKSVAQAVRARGLKLCVEGGPAFTGTAFSSIEYDWARLTLDEYFAMRRAELALIARELRPDLLAFGGEPDTEMMLTGLSYSVDQYLGFVRSTAAEIDRSSGVLVGAGSGSWDSPEYLDRLSLEPSIDFVNIHIYPLTNGVVDYIGRAGDASRTARARGKEVIIGEAWLYKATPEELRHAIDYSDVYARDVFGFWSPLDVQFTRSIIGLAEAEEVEYVSFFWSGYFYSYLPYDSETQALSTPERFLKLNQSQYAALLSGGLSPTGLALQDLLLGTGG